MRLLNINTAPLPDALVGGGSFLPALHRGTRGLCVCADEDGQRWRLKSRCGGDGVEGGIQFSLNGHCVYPSNRLVWKWDGKLS